MTHSENSKATLVFIGATKLMNRHKLTILCFASMGITCTLIGCLQAFYPNMNKLIVGLYILSKFFASCAYTGTFFKNQLIGIAENKRETGKVDPFVSLL